MSGTEEITTIMYFIIVGLFFLFYFIYLLFFIFLGGPYCKHSFTRPKPYTSC